MAVTSPIVAAHSAHAHAHVHGVVLSPPCRASFTYRHPLASLPCGVPYLPASTCLLAFAVILTVPTMLAYRYARACLPLQPLSRGKLARSRTAWDTSAKKETAYQATQRSYFDDEGEEDHVNIEHIDLTDATPRPDLSHTVRSSLPFLVDRLKITQWPKVLPHAHPHALTTFSHVCRAD